MFSLASIFELIMVFIVLIVVSTGIINTVLISVFERIRDIGTMRAIGMRKVQVLSIILIEAGILGFFASIYGRDSYFYSGGIISRTLRMPG